MRFLVISYETESVIAQAESVASAVEQAKELGYLKGYVINQDGGWQDLSELLEEVSR